MNKFKNFFIALLLIQISCTSSEDNLPEQKIYLDSNGVTIRCENCQVRDKAVVDGIEYEVVGNELLRQRRDEGADLTKLCTSLVTNTSGLFRFYDFNQAIGNWDVSNVTNMSFMFSLSTFNQDISNWNVENVKNMNSMFFGSEGFNQPIGKWDVKNVTDMNGMFRGCNCSADGVLFNRTNKFNHPLNSWDVGNVTNMLRMFEDSEFNQPLNKWNVSNVENMFAMFRKSSFNQNISMWCVTNFPQEPSAFSKNASLTESNKPIWGTCPD